MITLAAEVSVKFPLFFSSVSLIWFNTLTIITATVINRKNPTISPIMSLYRIFQDSIKIADFPRLDSANFIVLSLIALNVSLTAIPISVPMLESSLSSLTTAFSLTYFYLLRFVRLEGFEPSRYCYFALDPKSRVSACSTTAPKVQDTFISFSMIVLRN